MAAVTRPLECGLQKSGAHATAPGVGIGRCRPDVRRADGAQPRCGRCVLDREKSDINASLSCQKMDCAVLDQTLVSDTSSGRGAVLLEGVDRGRRPMDVLDVTECGDRIEVGGRTDNRERHLGADPLPVRPDHAPTPAPGLRGNGAVSSPFGTIRIVQSVVD